MNRRDFMKAAAAVPVVAAVPLSAADPVLAAIEHLGFVVRTKAVILNEDWLGFIHPTVESDLRTMAARWEWQHAWRQARLAGERDLSPREILKRFPLLEQESMQGVFQGFRIIERLPA